ncbi:Transmembrane protein [Globisporangium polare]
MKSPHPPATNYKLDDVAPAGSDGFQPLKTPEPLDLLEGGALRPGGTPNLLSRQHFGLILQYGVAGIVYGSVYGSIYPFLINYLRMSGIETTSAGVLVTIPATFKMFIGIVTDCVPIFGFRRRPYMVFGWVLASAMLLIMACTPIGEPYYPNRSFANVPVSKLTHEQIASFNTDAPQSGVKYIFLMALAYFGCVIAVTACDGILVELAQREPENVRGTAQTTISMAQDGFMVLSSSMVGFGMNGPEYGGSFSGSLGFNALMSICAALALLNIFSALFFVQDTKVTAQQRQSLRTYFKIFYDLLSERVVYQIIAFRFCRNLFSNFGVTASAPIQSVWAQVEPLNSSISTILGRVISVISLYVLKTYGLQWNWRRTLVVTQVAVVIIDCFPTFFTIWDVYRSQWFWLGVPLLEKLPNSMGTLISGYAVMEIVGVGHEASVYGLITTVATLASPFSSVLTKNVDAHFDIERSFLVEDDRHVRTQVTYAYLIAYGFKLISCVFVLLLPRQKAETQELKRIGGRNRVLGALVLVVYLFTLEWSVMTNMMTMFTSTKCLVIAGGTGCK